MKSPRSAEQIDPASVLDVGVTEIMQDGSVTVTLLVRCVPVEQVETLGRVLAVGIARHVGCGDPEAEDLANRVVAHLLIATKESLREPSDDRMSKH